MSAVPPVPAGQHTPPAEAVSAEARTAAAIAIARALIEAASDFGHENLIAGDVWTLADAAYAAAAPHIAAGEARFVAEMDTWQQAMAAKLRKAVAEARAEEQERCRRLVESYKGSRPYQPPEAQAELLERLLAQIGGAS